ncbi:MAG TPA: DNA repair protein RadC [Dehalococcoidia bacterium]|nr:DNA repair protein RadC [Dehalococcoidia bacterium]
MSRDPSIQYTTLIRDMPASERPRERLQQYGAEALSNGELLAILLRVGTNRESAISQANRLLSRYQGLSGLGRATFGELRSEYGVGEAKAAQIKAALELGKRLLATQPEERPTVKSPQEVANLLSGEMALLEQEHLRVIMLNTRNHVLSVREIYKGNVNSAVVRIGEIFRDPIRDQATAIIIVHNHPSGDPAPSPDDIALTARVYEAGNLLSIDLLDHVILARNGYFSLREHGLGFPAF